MKHIADFMVDNVEFMEKDMRHQLYLLCTQHYNDIKIAQKIKTSDNLRFKFFTCMDDCAGAYRKTKVEIYEEENE